MGNINDYALPQLKTILHIDDSAQDSDLLKLLEQAVYDLRRDMTVTVDDTSYSLSPAAAATSALWNVLALRAKYLYLVNEYNEFLRELEGASSFRDESTQYSRNETMRARRQEIADAKSEYASAKYKYSTEDVPAFGPMEEREPTTSEYTILTNLS